MKHLTLALVLLALAAADSQAANRVRDDGPMASFAGVPYTFGIWRIADASVEKDSTPHAGISLRLYPAVFGPYREGVDIRARADAGQLSANASLIVELAGFVVEDLEESSRLLGARTLDVDEPYYHSYSTAILRVYLGGWVYYNISVHNRAQIDLNLTARPVVSLQNILTGQTLWSSRGLVRIHGTVRSQVTGRVNILYHPPDSVSVTASLRFFDGTLTADHLAASKGHFPFPPEAPVDNWTAARIDIEPLHLYFQLSRWPYMYRVNATAPAVSKELIYLWTDV